jgi:AcrR family transcriptional regulator
VDDLLLEVGYAEMTMKGIAEKAGVGRQTVYRWWSTKAEVLFEASAADAEDELAINLTGQPIADVTAYLEALIRFLSQSPAGAAYRALLGEAQHDAAVATLLASRDLLGDSALAVLERIPALNGGSTSLDLAAMRLIGPALFWIITGRDPAQLNPRELAEVFLRELSGG